MFHMEEIHSAVTKGEKMEMFYIGGNTNIAVWDYNYDFDFAEVLHTS